MKPVLFVLYHFPPVTGPAVLRGYMFVKYLSRFGSHPYVLTSMPSRGEVIDRSLQNAFDEKKVFIKRIRKFELGSLDAGQKSGQYNRVRFLIIQTFKDILKNIVIPDKAVFWGVLSFFPGLKIIKNKRIGVIFSSFFPGTVHVLSYMYKLFFPNLKWIADFRDSWTLDPTLKRVSINQLINSILERMTMRNANALIFINNTIRDKYVRKYPGIYGKTYVLPNGYDEEDASLLLSKRKGDSIFRFLHAGTFSKHRIPDYFIQGLALYNRKATKKIKFTCVGTFFSNLEKKYLEELIESGQLEILPFVERKKLFEYYSECDSVVVVINQVKGAEEISTGKIFEYLMLKKPILIVGPDKGEASALISETGTGITAVALDIDDIYEKIKRIVDGEIMLHDEKSDRNIRKYSRSILAEELYEIMKGMVK